MVKTTPLLLKISSAELAGIPSMWQSRTLLQPIGAEYFESPIRVLSPNYIAQVYMQVLLFHREWHGRKIGGKGEYIRGRCYGGRWYRSLLSISSRKEGKKSNR